MASNIVLGRGQIFRNRYRVRVKYISRSLNTFISLETSYTKAHIQRGGHKALSMSETKISGVSIHK